MGRAFRPTCSILPVVGRALRPTCSILPAVGRALRPTCSILPAVGRALRPTCSILPAVGRALRPTCFAVTIFHMNYPPPKPGYSALRKGRVDLKEARYFLTITLQRPLPKDSNGLRAPALQQDLITRARSIDEWQLLCMVVMPDHIHLLVRLDSEKVARPVRLLKGRFVPLLRDCRLSWQPGFYDHRLRPEDKVGGVVRYMWLNPYRAKLCAVDEAWDGWWCSEEAAKWIGPTSSDLPSPAWWR